MAEKNLQIQLEEEMHHAMKQHNEVLLSTLRMLRSAISNRKIEKRGKMAKAGLSAEAGLPDGQALAKAGDNAPVDLSNEEVLEVIRSEAKRRRDAVTEFVKVGRNDLADKEQGELKILEQYLPAELSDEEIEKLVNEALKETGASSEDDFGRVMGVAMKKIAARASGNRVQDMVRKALSL